VREKILAMLTETDDYLSGEEISRRLGVSRAAVWKHIKVLQEEGCCIEAVTNKGYKLKEGGLRFAEQLPYLKTKWLGRKQKYLAVTESTNIEAKIAGENGEPNGFVVFSDQQLAGRGRLGRPWTSPAGQGIWFSILLRPNIEPAVAPQLTLASAVGIAEALQKLGFNAGIKWPNDIFIDGYKVCGMLTEMDSDMDKVNYVIVGIGVNVLNEEFPEELKNIATSLKIEADKNKIEFPPRNVIAAELLNTLEPIYETLYKEGFKPIREKWLASNITVGQRVKVTTVTEETLGHAKSMNDEGYLIIETDSGEEKTVIYGDVTFPDKYKR
jgi:BirA family biotin operon repressor/biotin-[acetyl-CoA-carboxylase] ligase